MPRQQIRDLSVHYEDIGSGAPILFLHSSYNRGILAFACQMQAFSDQYRCLIPDLRGHGRTRSASLEWSTPQMANDMAAFLTSMGIASAHLVGYSLGGGVALHMAAMYPGRVRSITTIGCGGVADPSGADDYEPEALESSGQTAFIERMKTLHAEAHGGDWRQYLRESARDWRRYPDLSDEQWRRLTMPMLLIAGENDSFAPEDRLLRIRDRCPQAEILIVPGGSHRPHTVAEQPMLVNQRILSFIAKTADRELLAFPLRL